MLAWSRWIGPAAVAQFFALGITGCAPLTTYRSTGLVPLARPIPWDGQPNEAGTFHVDATLAHSDVLPDLLPTLHETALFIGATTLDGSFGYTPIKGLELGLRASYASYRWGQETADGTMPIPSRDPVWGLGPEIRVAFHPSHDEHFAIGFAGNAMHYEVPYAEWKRDDSCTGSSCVTTTGYSTDGTFTDTARYTLINSGVNGSWAFNFGVYPSYAFGDHGEYGTLTASISAHTTFANDGFDDSPPSDDKPYASGFAPMVGVGYSLHIAALKLGVLAYLPLLTYQDQSRETAGAMLTIGFDFGRKLQTAQ